MDLQVRVCFPIAIFISFTVLTSKNICLLTCSVLLISIKIEQDIIKLELLSTNLIVLSCAFYQIF